MEVGAFLPLVFALAVGLIIGLERGWKRRDNIDGENDGPGARTFALVGLLGGVGGLLDSVVFAVVIFAAVALIVSVGYVKSAVPGRVPGYTTEVAVLVTYLLGFMAVKNSAELAVGVAVVVALILSLKPEIHGALRHVQRLELLSTLQLLVVAVVVLPLLPNEDIWIQGFNPHLIGWFVLLVLGLSWLGYIALRFFSERLGVLVTAFLGGLASSTAVTASFARRTAQQPALAAPFGRGILVACMIMPVRLLILVAVINHELLIPLLPGFTMLIGVPLVAIVIASLKPASTQPRVNDLDLGTPLDIKSAAWFGAFLSALSIAVPWMQSMFGDMGIYGAAALSGLSVVDAIGLTLARESLSQLSESAASLGIVIAATSNTFVKAILSSTFSKGALARSTGFPLLLTGVAATLVQWLWQ